MRNTIVVAALVCLITASIHAQSDCAPAPDRPLTQIAGSTFVGEAGKPMSFSVVPSSGFFFGPLPPRTYQIRPCDRARWDFGDGSPVIEVGALDAVNHAFPRGLWLVKVTVTNNIGSDSHSRLVHVSSSPATIVRVRDIEVAESVGTVQIRVQREGNLSSTATVSYNNNPVFTPASGIIEAVSGTLTFAPGETEKFVPIRITADNVFRLGIRSSFDIESNDGTWVMGGTPLSSLHTFASAKITLIDDDTPPTVTLRDNESLEGGFSHPRGLVFVVNLSAPLQDGAQFKLELLPEGPAANLRDLFSLGPYFAFMPAGSTGVAFSVSIRDDRIPEETERITVRLVPGLLPITRGTATGTILDDDAGFMRPSHRIPRGSSITLNLHTGPHREINRTVLLKATNPGVIDIPASVVVPAYATSIDVPVTALRAGESALSASLDGVVHYLDPLLSIAETTVVVFEPSTLNASTRSVNVRAGDEVEVLLTMNPPRSQSQLVLLSSTDPTTASVPSAVTIPSGAAAVVKVKGLAAGRATVRAQTADGDDATQFDVVVSADSSVAIDRIEPTIGETTGGTRVQLRGNGLSDACRVTFGPIAATSVQTDGSGLVATTPAHPAGVVDVSVDCGGRKATLPRAFTFFDPRNRPTRR